MFYAVSVITYNKGRAVFNLETHSVGSSELNVDEHIVIVDAFSEEAAKVKAEKTCRHYLDENHKMMGTGRDIAGARRAIKDFDIDVAKAGHMYDGLYYACHSFVLDASRDGIGTLDKLLNNEPVNVWSPTGISAYEEGLNDIRRFTDETMAEKLARINSFMYNFARNINKRPHMFGSVELIEGFFSIFDSIFNIINHVENNNGHGYSMSDYYNDSGRLPDYSLDKNGLSSKEALTSFMNMRDDYIVWQSGRLGISENFFIGSDDDAGSVIATIEKFIEDFMRESKLDPEAYGSVEVLERKWEALDKFWFILIGKHYKGIPFSTINYPPDFSFGVKTYAMIAHERNPYNPYMELLNIRDGYEGWRKKAMEKSGMVA